MSFQGRQLQNPTREKVSSVGSEPKLEGISTPELPILIYIFGGEPLDTNERLCRFLLRVRFRG